MKSLTIRGKTYQLPIYLPDATRGVVRTLDSSDLYQVGIEGMVVNTYHLMTEPGTQILDNSGGIKEFMNWDGFITSDSGGFQVLSLIYQNPSFGKINDDGVIFYKSSSDLRRATFSSSAYRSSKGEKRKYTLTPEKSIQVQFSIGSDLIVCLDDVAPLNAKEDYTKLAVERTIKWAKRCKEEFEKQVKQRGLTDETRPILMAVVQGGDFPELRKYCAQELIKIGFDAYGYGGFPMDSEGNFRRETLKLVADLTPSDKPKFALGVGTPQDIRDGFLMGYNIFDCVLPTRDARHKRLYVFPKNPEEMDILNEEKVFEFLNLDNQKFIKDNSPISPWCNCHTCKNYSKAYLYHLFNIEEFTAGRLASIHNLRTYTKTIELLRKV